MAIVIYGKLFRLPIHRSAFIKFSMISIEELSVMAICMLVASDRSVKQK
jgi:hypothetical protein